MLHPTKRMFGRRESRLEISYSKYYIVQIQKNQVSRMAFIATNTNQQTNAVANQPQIVPLYAIAT